MAFELSPADGRLTPGGRRQLLCRGAGVALLGVCGVSGVGSLLSGCASTGPREFTLSERQILVTLAERFPANRRVLEIFDVRLASPKLKLLPAEDRLMLGFDLGVQERMLTSRTFKGNLMFSSGLRFDTGDSTVRLARVRRENIAIDGLPSLLASNVNRWGGLLAEDLLEGAVVHKVEQSAIDQAARMGLRPGALKVTEGGVMVTLEPIRAQGA
ncbi:hypothetical protein [Sphaerotilus sp.]|uniref:hypothetical protein n=1 Tax=Sphaerotilus sp. TaxID=2093942 RepID=UPI00286DED6B|nr:hypothetical protein [Sphaerotilus sp.]